MSIWIVAYTVGASVFLGGVIFLLERRIKRYLDIPSYQKREAGRLVVATAFFGVLAIIFWPSVAAYFVYLGARRSLFDWIFDGHS